MFMLLRLLYSFISDQVKYKRGWKKYIIYPFIWLWYCAKVDYIVRKYIKKKNPITFKDTIIEYASFLTYIMRTTSMNINDIIIYKNTTSISITYDIEDAIKSILYIYKAYGCTITLNINESIKLMNIEVKTKYGCNVFSFASMIDSNLLDAKNYIEEIIRDDIAANLRHILIDNRY
jgi:hypothetical protein